MTSQPGAGRASRPQGPRKSRPGTAPSETSRARNARESRVPGVPGFHWQLTKSDAFYLQIRALIYENVLYLLYVDVVKRRILQRGDGRRDP